MDHLYIISYDICDDRRWRRLYKLMKGYGQWLQLSVFQCRLDKMKILRLENSIREIVHFEEDHVLVMDLGPADQTKLRVRSIGRQFEPVDRRPVII